MINALEWILNNADGDDWIAIIYSGHGYYSNGVSMLDLPDGTSLSQDFFISFDRELNSLYQHHVFYFFDACYAGEMKRLTNAKYVEHNVSNTFVAMASDDQHESYEDDTLKHGIFTYYFIKHLTAFRYISMGPNNCYTLRVKVFSSVEDAFKNAKYEIKTKWQKYNMSPALADGNPNRAFFIDVGYIYGGGWTTPLDVSVIVKTPA